ncbi:hypothetical protein B0186_07125 [Canicola haemoglobinophilus]|uniref:1,4-alpha-galactosyltransferase (LgtC) n=1 Tax=Canicola haemoglobinophilus TaxID=733 RepID=A0A1V4B0U4_9PAST|nr:glycosyltransferase family 8 protein [Canicola haemoglobinophilus]OOS00130.1 hypothetical protein B0186_07125 [Canicola haemoglobinophilus]STO53798.1 1,4-alpha-galactosyltransferase (LgtC) [Canicola haemoglobinophilus]STO60772.1 1,4-alpha-galactosyltransferase (LgtC) [Canicola haemoglobinophilus]STO68331.1 1,4-alpha-galactosyltransferase (LgtC) [Canicola haemoglobinophilus]
MNIVFSCDDNYAPYLSVSIFSILKNTRKKIDFYILDLGISSESKNKILEIFNKNSVIINFISIDKNDFLNFPNTISYISIATYARLKLDYYLPNLDKVIYLDVDTLVLHDLTELWELNLENHAIAACIDSYVEYLNGYKYKIGLNEDDIYFNAGVLLIDLIKFRALNVYENSISFLQKYPNIEYQDQDILNFIFKDHTKMINPRFNFMPALRNRIRRKFKLNQFEELVSPIVVIHYCSSKKAWHKNCPHTKSYLFYSLFTEIKDKPDSWKNKVEKANFLMSSSVKIKDIRNKFIYGIKY